MAKQNLSVGEALNQVNETQQVRRALWPEGVHLKVHKGLYPIDAPAVDIIDGVHPKHFIFSEGGLIVQPELRMTIKNAEYDTLLLPADILAQDWEII